MVRSLPLLGAENDIRRRRHWRRKAALAPRKQLANYDLDLAIEYHDKGHFIVGEIGS